MEFYPARHEQTGLSAACLEDGSIVIRRGTDGIWRPAGKLSPEEGREIMGEEFSLCCP